MKWALTWHNSEGRPVGEPLLVGTEGEVRAAFARPLPPPPPWADTRPWVAQGQWGMCPGSSLNGGWLRNESLAAIHRGPPAI